jgi:HD-like signal output (HDOD) protein
MSENEIAKRVESCLSIEWPVLPETSAHVEALGASAGMAMRDIGPELLTDPGLALKLIETANGQRQRHFHEAIVDLDKSVRLLGVNRVASLARELPQLADPLPTHVQTQIRRLYARSWLTALICADWASRRRDIAPQEVALAGLFYHVGGITLWLERPEQMMQLEALRQLPGTVPEEAEYVVLGFNIEHFGHALARSRGLPQLAVESMAPRYAQEPRTLGVMLAAQVAYQATHSWAAPHARVHLEMARRYLDMAWTDFVELVNGVLERFNQRGGYYGLRPLAPLSVEWEATSKRASAPAALCLAPRSDRLGEAVALITRAVGNPAGLIEDALGLMRDALGLNRLMFARQLDDGTLIPQALVGTEYEPDFNYLRFEADPRSLFSVLMRKPSAIRLDAQNVDKYWPHVPVTLRQLLEAREFMAMSIFVDGRPFGLLYADRRNPACRIDARSFETFKRLGNLMARRLEQLPSGSAPASAHS